MSAPTLLKYWRESASLIVATNRLVTRTQKKTLLDKILRKKPLPAKITSDENLRLLLLKRSSGNTFMPNNYVFPGGILDNTDFSQEWLEILGGDNSLLSLFKRSHPGSPIFSRDRGPALSALPSDVALRLAAVRETFEESGLLLARPKSDFVERSLFDNSVPCYATVCELPETVAVQWRTNIISDSSQFLVMCRELGMVPDVWSLYEWSNWLTPPMRMKRFDTAFFVCCIDEAREISLSDESSEGKWAQPADALTECCDGKIVVAPPQMYELSRLVRFQTVDDLLKFAWARALYRVDRWMPVVFSCSGGMVFVLPGDDLYPENPDLTGESMPVPIYRTETPEELNKLYPRHHRVVIDKDTRISIYCNVALNEGHVVPCELISRHSSQTA